MSEDPLMMVDPEYEHLHRATDAGLMQPRFEREIGRISGRPVAFKEFYISRVFPREKGSFAIQYSGILRESAKKPPRRLLFCGCALGPSVSWPDYALRRDGHSFVLEDVRLAVPVFPFDPALPRLPELYDLGKVSLLKDHLVGSMGFDGGEMNATDCEVLGYRLERRCVLRYTLGRRKGPDDHPDGCQAVAKIMRPGRSAGSFQALARLASNGFGPGAKDGIVVPQVYYSDDAMGAIFMENSPGTTLHLLIGKPIFEKACGRAGRMLRKLHATDAEGLRPYMATDEMGNFGNRFKTAIKLYPLLGGSYERVLESLSGRRIDIESGYDPVCTHRDFYDKQVLYSTGLTTLLDCDNLAMADPALDFGNFMAHLILRRMQTPEWAEDIGSGMKAFANSYSQPDSEFELRARWWMAASLMRLAALYSLRPRWRSLSPKLLEEAGRSLDRREFIYGGTDAIDTN
jgi:hypothetical protein